MNPKPKLTRGSTVVVTFVLGNPSSLEALLVGMYQRAAVADPPGLLVEIDGVTQLWWIELIEEQKRQLDARLAMTTGSFKRGLWPR